MAAFASRSFASAQAAGTQAPEIVLSKNVFISAAKEGEPDHPSGPVRPYDRYFHLLGRRLAWRNAACPRLGQSWVRRWTRRRQW